MVLPFITFAVIIVAAIVLVKRWSYTMSQSDEAKTEGQIKEEIQGLKRTATPIAEEALTLLPPLYQLAKISTLKLWDPVQKAEFSAHHTSDLAGETHEGQIELIVGDFRYMIDKWADHQRSTVSYTIESEIRKAKKSKRTLTFVTHADRLKEVTGFKGPDCENILAPLRTLSPVIDIYLQQLRDVERADKEIERIQKLREPWDV